MGNLELLAAAEAAGFAASVTTDTNVRHQQNIAGWPLGILVLPTTDWSRIPGQRGPSGGFARELSPGTVVEETFAG